MLTTTIRQRVRDNLNRDDVGIDSRIEAWINDVRRDLELLYNMDYMRKGVTLTVTNAAPSALLPARFKEPIVVRYRKTAPTVEASWTPLVRLDETEVLAVSGFDGAGDVVTGHPHGFTLEETTLTVHPRPRTGETYEIRLIYYEYSADWTFDGSEEPYLARNAPSVLIERATAAGLAALGEMQDAEHREMLGERASRRWRSAEAARELKGPIELRPRTGAADEYASRARGWGVR